MLDGYSKLSWVVVVVVGQHWMLTPSMQQGMCLSAAATIEMARNKIIMLPILVESISYKFYESST